MTDQNVTPPAASNEDLGIGLKIVCFLLPIVGLILYFVYKSDAPQKSKSACKMAIWGVVLGIVINIIAVVASR